MVLKRKGISPLVATVLLIAFTISVGAIIGAWVTGFSKTESDKLGRDAKDLLDCTGANLKFNPEDILNDSIIVNNIGDFEFTKFSIIIQNQTGNSIIVNQYTTGDVSKDNPLKIGDKRIISNSSMNILKGNKVIIRSVECPSVEHSEIKGN